MFWIDCRGAIPRERGTWTAMTGSCVVRSTAMSARSGVGFPVWSRTFPWRWRGGLGNSRFWYTRRS